MKKISVFILSSVLLTSCAVIKDSQSQGDIKVEKTDFAKLNGRISNLPTAYKGFKADMVSNELLPMTFWSQINRTREEVRTNEFENQTVTIDFISNKKAIVKLWNMDTLKGTKELKGRIKKGYFYGKFHSIVIPFVPLIFGYNSNHYRIGMTNKSVAIDYKWDYWMFAILAGNYSKGQVRSEYEKK